MRIINYRYEIRQVNDSTDEVLHTTNSKDDGVKYVEQYTSAHSDLFMYDLKEGIIVTTSTPWESVKIISKIQADIEWDTLTRSPTLSYEEDNRR